MIQDVVKLVLQCDLNRDGMIDKREATILAKRLSLGLEIYGIVFDTDKFFRAVGLSPSICGVLTIVRRLLPDEDNRLSSFYSAHSDDDEAPVDEYDSEGRDADDVFDMFYQPVEHRFDKGDAVCIQLCKEYVATKGERPTLISIAQDSLRGLRCSICRAINK